MKPNQAKQYLLHPPCWTWIWTFKMGRLKTNQTLTATVTLTVAPSTTTRTSFSRAAVKCHWPLKRKRKTAKYKPFLPPPETLWTSTYRMCKAGVMFKAMRRWFPFRSSLEMMMIILMRIMTIIMNMLILSRMERGTTGRC